MWEELIQTLIKKGLISADKKAELEAVLDEVKIEQPVSGIGRISVDTSKFPPELKETIDTLVNMVNALKMQNKNLLDTLGAEKTAREQAIKAAEEQAKKEKEKRISALMEDAFGDGKEKKGKLPEAKKEWFKSFAEKDLEAAEEFLKEYPGDPHLEDDPDNQDKKGKGGEKKINPMMGAGIGNPDIFKAVKEQSSVGESFDDIFKK